MEMEKEKISESVKDIIGIVIFNRGISCPKWIKPIFWLGIDFVSGGMTKCHL